MTMRIKISTLLLVAGICFAPIGLAQVAYAAELSISVPVPSQRTVAISKISAKTSSQAILIAERKNPGWKVVNIKEHSKHWGITMKKP